MSCDPTPRITHLFLVWAEAAADLRRRLGRLELILGGRVPEKIDVLEAKRARAFRGLAEAFENTFRAWPGSTASQSRKQQQRAEFEAFLSLAHSFLGGHE